MCVEVQRTAMSSPFALKMESLFASSSFRISCSVRVRSVALISWEASNAALAAWAMVSALKDMVWELRWRLYYVVLVINAAPLLGRD
jgi:hypothetical protein